MKKCTILFIILYSITGLKAQNIIAVQNGSQVNFYTDFHTALHAAPSGATIYIPGGVWGHTGENDTISQTISIIGVGHYPDSTLATSKTVLQDNLYFVQGSNNSTLEGFELTGSISYGNSNSIIYNLLLYRMMIDGSVTLDNQEGTTAGTSKFINTDISQCICQGSISGTEYESLNTVIESSIIACLFYHNGALFRNNYFLGGCDPEHAVVIYSTFENNFFGHGCTWQPNDENDVYSNNLFTCDTLHFCASCTSISNLSGGTLSNTFVNVPVNNVFSYDYDYHLVGASLAINAGTDGTDIGIYGTVYPYKEGAVPSNPHIQYINIAPQTSGGGNLPVNIHTAAQTY